MSELKVGETGWGREVSEAWGNPKALPVAPPALRRKGTRREILAARQKWKVRGGASLCLPLFVTIRKRCPSRRGYPKPHLAKIRKTCHILQVSA